MSLRAIGEVVGVSKSQVARDLEDAEVSCDGTPEVDDPEPEPLPAQPTRADRIAELLAEGWWRATGGTVLPGFRSSRSREYLWTCSRPGCP